MYKFKLGNDILFDVDVVVDMDHVMKDLFFVIFFERDFDMQ